MRPVRSLFLALACSGVCVSSAWAQRADDDAVTAADDAFGTTVGNETIGLYDAKNARGFNPQSSGNTRVEGLYFNRPSTGPGDVVVDRLMTGFTVRVGINALTFPFPAPSAVVDVKLRAPGAKRVTSVVASAGPYNQTSVELDTQIPLIPGVLSIGGGVERTRFVTDMRRDADDSSLAGLLRWTPNGAIEIIPFWGRGRRAHYEQTPWIFVGGDWMPPDQTRGVDFAQDWAIWEQIDTNMGVIGRVRLGTGWTLRTGVFRATYDRGEERNVFYNNTQADGASSIAFQSTLPLEIVTTSGEAQLQRVFVEGPRRHSFYMMARGREYSRDSGGTAQVAYGTINLNTVFRASRPDFVFGPRGRDEVAQITGGIQYVGEWRGVGDMNLGIQKTSYERTLSYPQNPAQVTSLAPWLYNGSLSFRPSPQLTLFTSYAKGLEDQGQTPQSARNRGEGVPSAVTRQMDLGWMYTFSPVLRMNGALFQISKPYFDRDLTNLYTIVGDLRHRGFEFSFTGQVTERVTMVAGAVLLKARVSGDLVDRGLVGSIPIGRDSRAARLDLQYALPWISRLSADGQVEYIDKGPAASLNRADIPPRTVLNLGMRRGFRVSGASATLRARVQNVANTYSWDLQGGSNYFLQYLPPRRFTASLSADF